ncbi:MAG: exonuclease domain-containing protein [Proteobacteria bacterium]|nr:exonuclease domain-containing protein [Pseudomonadota bacterium]
MTNKTRSKHAEDTTATGESESESETENKSKSKSKSHSQSVDTSIPHSQEGNEITAGQQQHKRIDKHKSNTKRSSGRKSTPTKHSNKARGGDGHTLLPKLRHLVQQPLDSSTFIIFDIETTGGNPERNGITELAAMKVVHGEVVAKFHSLVNPMIPIPPIVRKMTGITNQLVKDAPVIDEIFPDFVDFIGDHILVSHNTIGDLIFLRHFARDTVGHDLKNFFLCTHLLVEKLASEAPDKSLKGLSKFFDLAGANFHRAEADTVQTWELFKVLLNRLKDRGITKVEHAIRLQSDLDSSLRLGWSISPDKLLEVPQTSGMFYLYDHERRLLFLSSALNLNREVAKLEQYDLVPRPILRLALRSYDIKTTRFPNLFSAMLAECDDREKFSLQADPTQLHQRQVQVVGIYKDKGGQRRVSVGPIEPGLRHAFGPVKDRKRAMDFLEDLALALGEKTTRSGMLLSHENRDVVVNLLMGTLTEFQRKIEKSMFGLKLMFWRRSALQDQQKRLNTISSLMGLTIEGKTFWPPSSLLHGIIVVPHEGNNWQVFSILGGLPKEIVLLHGEWKQKLCTGGVGKRILDRLISSAKVFKRPTTYSHGDLARLNAVMWWLQFGKSKDHGFYFSIEEFTHFLDKSSVHGSKESKRLKSLPVVDSQNSKNLDE